MSDKINQISVASSVKFFKEGLMKRWNLVDYYDKDLPCLFFGLRHNVELINEHRGFALVVPGESLCGKLSNKITKHENIVFVDFPSRNTSKKFKHVAKLFEIKDYSIFKPKPLGNKIYAYFGTGNRTRTFRHDGLQRIQSKINYEIVCAKFTKILPIEVLKKEYYDNTFLSINLSTTGGLTTVTDLAFMGIKTISNHPIGWDCFLRYKDESEIIDIINTEANKIGSVQPAINVFNANEVWQNTNYWIEQT
tara:strand:- start:284 stop:1033 length:750 start_codon:yes stop_codon:yes gene_type:complete